MAEGYESFFSCTHTSERGRAGYSGVATFCRVKLAFLGVEVALPEAAKEGFSSVLEKSQLGRGDVGVVAHGLKEFGRDELIKVDNEGSCVVTDHGHFVMFNLYGPRAVSDDAERRIELKLNFYKILQGKYDDTVRECMKALELNPSYIKALVRRGQAHEEEELEHFEEAIADF